MAIREGTHLGTDTLISRLSVRGRKICFVLSNLLMLFCCVLMAQGTWRLVEMNIATTSPVMEVSQALFYGSGIFGAVLGGLMIAHKLWRMKAGRLPDSELIGVRESEEDPVDIPTPSR